MQTIMEKYPEYKTNDYFFTSLLELTNIGDIFDLETLKADFFTKYSSRFCAPVVKIWEEKIPTLLAGHYKEKWNRYAGVYKSTYEAIENYDRYEEWEDNTAGTQNKTGTDTNEEEVANTGTETLTMQKGTSEKEARDLNTLTERYGINTNEGHPDAKIGDSGNVTRTNSGSDTDTKQITEQRKNNAKTIYNNLLTLQNGLKHTGHTHGNIGVTTSQQMLQSELELWKWDFLEDVAEDIANLLTLPIY